MRPRPSVNIRTSVRIVAVGLWPGAEIEVTVGPEPFASAFLFRTVMVGFEGGQRERRRLARKRAADPERS